ncbi:Dihydropyrimidinase [Camellia lanceoleosa]|uniref:Dihydropyrimidinase n=1 Tax=Camellia lanceoleosa TaxID=1840588 RepID=A0ACC0GU75_9ERIC|nr:Dihydropyrimidinase [Camellia lanceoleosa]
MYKNIRDDHDPINLIFDSLSFHELGSLEQTLWIFHYYYLAANLSVSIPCESNIVLSCFRESSQISITNYVRITCTEWYADIIIFNPNSSFEISATSHHSRLDTNVFEGRRGKLKESAWIYMISAKEKALNRDAAYGKVEVTIAGGRIVWENGQLKVAPNDGKYVEMQPFSYLFGGIDKAEAKYLSPSSSEEIQSHNLTCRFNYFHYL